MSRRYGGRHAAGPTVYANQMNGGPVPDPMTLIRAFDSDTNPTRPVRPSPLTASTIQGLPLDLLDRLRSFPLFLSAPDSFLTAIGKHLRPQLYQPHDYILTEGDDAKSMYWLVRGAVRVASRDGESTYAELKPGAFFGEIGILMDIPRTATIIAKMKSMVVRLNKEDLTKELPQYPEVEKAIREEAKERLAILERKKKEISQSASQAMGKALTRNGKRPRDGDVEMGDAGTLTNGEVVSSFKKRKSPSPGLAEAAAISVFGSGSVNIRQLLKELPLFSGLPPEILHFLGLNAQPRTYPPFTEVIQQGSQGRDVFFIVRGEVEVLVERTTPHSSPQQVNGHFAKPEPIQQVKARMKPGMYFGEVTSLSLAPRRTATIRTISSVECLMISGEVLNELWERCSPSLRSQVESTARQRLRETEDMDISMTDASSYTPAIDELAIADTGPRTPKKKSVPTVTFSETPTEPLTPSRKEAQPVIEPFDPDPYLNVDLDNMRSRSRRGSLAPPQPMQEQQQSTSPTESPKPSPPNGQINAPISPSPLSFKHESTPPEPAPAQIKKPKIIRKSSQREPGVLPDNILVNIFQHLDIASLMRLRLVCMHWLKLLTQSPDILSVLDLSSFNRKVTDSVLSDVIAPFAGTRPRVVDISNCFHITDEGFAELANVCAQNVRCWKMKSVWDITGQAILEMVNKAKGLQEVDLSNCRKVGDNLLARVVGWVVPQLPAEMLAQQQQALQNNRSRLTKAQQAAQAQQAMIQPGTVVGCPQLKRLTLSYCKHITDKSMAHIAVHASNRIEEMDLTRCTTITDQGFQHWSVYPFPRLRRLCLADCTYLTDGAIVSLCNAAKGLRELDLSFCCALSDTATEVLALGLPALTHLNLAFCGSAVSDGSLRSISLHLLELQYLSVRGCVRVTGMGVEAVTEGCHQLEHFDVSQCKHLQTWLDRGGVEKVNRARQGFGSGGVGGRKPMVKFDTVADGRWRTGR